MEYLKSYLNHETAPNGFAKITHSVTSLENASDIKCSKGFSSDSCNGLRNAIRSLLQQNAREVDLWL